MRDLGDMAVEAGSGMGKSRRLELTATFWQMDSSKG